jgi:hypothetical protein
MSKSNPSLRLVCFALFSGFVLGACDSSSSTTSITGTTDTSNQPASSNIALSGTGATVTSSFSGNETFVIDGDTAMTSYWEPGANGDTLTIDFSRVYSIESVNFHYANMANTTYFLYELSVDGSSYTTVQNYSDCSSFRLSASVYECGLTDAVDARFLRLTILDNAANIDIYEVEVMGR